MKKETKQLTVKDEMTEFLLYTSPNREIKVEVFLHDENMTKTMDYKSQI